MDNHKGSKTTKMLTYHQRTIDYLQIPVEIDEDRKRLLDETEKRFGIVIPPAVREWYELKLPERYTWTAETTYFGETSELIEHDYTIENGYLAIDWEYEQEDSYVFVKIDGSDDPEIVGIGFTRGRIRQYYSGVPYSDRIFNLFWSSVIIERVKYQINVTLDKPISKEFRQKIRDAKYQPIEVKSDNILRFQKDDIHIMLEENRYEWDDSDVDEVTYYTRYKIGVPTVQIGCEIVKFFWDDIKDGDPDTFPDVDNDVFAYIQWLLGRYPFQIITSALDQTESNLERIEATLKMYVGYVKKLQFWDMFGNYDAPKTSKIVGTYETMDMLLEKSTDPSSKFFAILQDDGVLHWRLMAKTAKDLDKLVGILNTALPETAEHLGVESFAPNYDEMTKLLQKLKAKYT